LSYVPGDGDRIAPPPTSKAEKLRIEPTFDSPLIAPSLTAKPVLTNDDGATASPRRLRARVFDGPWTWRRIARFAGLAVAAYFATVLFLILAYRLINPPTTTLIAYQWLTGTTIQQDWQPIENISPNLLRAVVVSEDWGFCDHYGVDIDALEKALELAGEGKIARGASTISMQVIKNLFLSQSKSYLRKAVEIPLTVVAETVWPKSRMLEIYLNIAEWGPGIFGAEVDRESCTQLVTAPQILFSYDPAVPWERYGEYNEDRTRSYVEGPWMVKAGGGYYLTYAAPGTEWRTYGMGALRGTSPLGPFTRQRRTPFCSRTEGLIQGPGHGCVVRGPGDSLWAFYTLRVCYEHNFERRIGFDPCGIDAQGELYVNVSEFPQWAPGVLPRPEQGNATGLLPMNHRRFAGVSSNAPGRPGLYAVDNCMHTWWEPAAGDATPTVEQDLGITVAISALRLVWRDVGLDYAAGRLPGPFRWRFETMAADGTWSTAVDATSNPTDLLIDYRTFAERLVRRVRLTITGWPAGLTPGLTDMAVFGRT